MSSPRAIGTATVSFGLVSIPVKIFSTVESGAAVSFKQIDPKTNAPVKQKLVNKHGDEVDRAELVKGYEIGKDQYLIFSSEEIDSAAVKATKSIDISEFVPLDSIDPVYYDKPYYLVPDKGGAKPYWLIHGALADSGLCAIAQYASRGKQYLVMIRTAPEGLVMQQLHYPDEIRPWSALEGLDRVDVSAPEVGLAKQLVGMNQKPGLVLLDGNNEPRFVDTVRAKLMEMIHDKLEGKAIVIEAEPETANPTVDLMAALQASLAAMQKK